MYTTRRTRLTAALACAALALAAGCGTSSFDLSFTHGPHVVRSTRFENGVLTVEWREGKRVTRIDTAGEIELAEDGRSVAGVAPDAFLSIEEESPLGRRSVAFRPGDVDDEPVTFYRFDGEVADPDPEWIARVLGEIRRHTPIGAEARARRLLEEGGPLRLLAELESVDSPSVQEIYVERLLEEPELGSDVLARTAEAAARAISSSSTQAEVLRAVARRHRESEELSIALVTAADAVSSTSSQLEILRAVTHDRRVTPGVARALLDAVPGLSSTSAQTELLADLLRRAPREGDFCSRFVGQVSSLSSSSSQARLYGELLDQPELGVDALHAVIRALESLSSSSSRTEVLVHVLERAPDDLQLLTAWLDAVDRISSSSSQARCLELFLARDGLDRPILRRAGESIERVSSTSARESLQRELIELLVDAP